MFLLLNQTLDDELLLLMRRQSPGSAIAWAEFGRRHYQIPYGLESGKSEPIIFSPKFDAPS